MDEIRRGIADLIGLDLDAADGDVGHRVFTSSREQGYVRQRIEYGVGGDRISAYLLLPDAPGPYPAVLIHHQHNGERHFRKSEVCGLVGDPWQAFGPELARRGSFDGCAGHGGAGAGGLSRMWGGGAVVPQAVSGRACIDRGAVHSHDRLGRRGGKGCW